MMIIGKLQMVKLRVFTVVVVNGGGLRGFGVEITFGVRGSSVEFSIPPIYATQDEALKIARSVVELMEATEPEQVWIVEGFGGVSERVEFKRDKN